MSWSEAVTAIVEGIGQWKDFIFEKDLAAEQKEFAEHLFWNNYMNQKEFARMGVRWTVEDAEAAGIHPLAALGVQPRSYQPSAVGYQRARPSFSGGRMGQNIARAIGAKQTPEERKMADLQIEKEEANVKGLGLRNDLLEKELNAPSQIPPPIIDSQTGEMIPGQVQTYEIKPKPASKPGQQGVETGHLPFSVGTVDEDGWFQFLPTQEVSEALESAPIVTRMERNVIELIKSAKRRVLDKEGIKKMLKIMPRPSKGKKWIYVRSVGSFRQVPVSHGVRKKYKSGSKQGGRYRDRPWRHPRP